MRTRYLLSFALLWLVAFGAMAQDAALPSFTSGKFKYEIVDAANHWVQIAPKNVDGGGYGSLVTNDFKSEVTYNGETYQVKGVGAYAFYNCSLSTGRLVLPEGMIYIDDNAFEGAEVGTMRLPSTMQYISDYAFIGNKFQAFGVVSSNPWFAIHNSDQEGVNVSVLTNKAQTTLLAFPGDKAREFSSDGTATYVTSFTVPEQITEIGNLAFSDNKHITRVTFHNGITRIGMGAFHGSVIGGVNIPNPETELGNACFEQCTSLTSVRLPQGMKRLGRHVFFFCSSLTSVTLPEGMEELGMMCFGSCGLTTVNLPSTMVKLDTCALQDNPFTSIDLKNVRWVGYQCFSMCDNLTTLTCNGQVERIDGLTFARCNGITNPWLPEGLKTMEMNVFFRSPNFASLTVPSTVECMEGNPCYLANKCKEYRVAEGNTHFVALDSCIYATNGYTTLPEGTAWPALTEAGTAPTALVGVPTARENKVLIVPEGVTTICNQAARAVELTQVQLPSTMAELRKMCFTGINTITRMTCLAVTPPVVGEGAISGTTYSEATLYVPLASVEAYRNAEGWSNFQHIEGIDTGTEPALAGDLNGDGVVDVEDVNTLINIVLGVLPETSEADLNGDGTADIADVNALINTVLN
ncbi:MAG: leucine-rich repeat protein [Muribaculaceae bacterium]|nr:leucine-rich repeat protein [Muribaculaceae bacterium]